MQQRHHRPGRAHRDVRYRELPERELLRGQRARSRGSRQAWRALFFVTLWTVAPFVALLGVALRARGHLFGIRLVLVGFAIDATSIISMGGGFVFALLCGPLLLIALIATLSMRVR